MFARQLGRLCGAHEGNYEVNPRLVRYVRMYPCFLRRIGPSYENNITSFYGSSCANNGKDALNTPDV